jgi:selenocysteine-specific elongation factor
MDRWRIRGVSRAEIRSITGWTAEALIDAVGQLNSQGLLIECDDIFISPDHFNALEDIVLKVVERMLDADRLTSTIPLDKLRAEVFRSSRPQIERAVLQSLSSRRKLAIEGDVVKLVGRDAQLSESEIIALSQLRTTFESAGLEVPKPDQVIERAVAASHVDRAIITKLFQQLVSSGELVRIDPDIVICRSVAERLIENVREYARTSPDRHIDIPKFKEIAGVSRKYAIPLLEYFDLHKYTIRDGDTRRPGPKLRDLSE